jgi:DNA-binding transcriptional ArsR family regulator
MTHVTRKTEETDRPLPALEFVPAERYVIQTLEELRALSNPLRLRILDYLIEGPSTVKQLGELLGTTSKTLYYHVGELDRLGLVRLVHAEVQSGIQVKYYRAVAACYWLPASMLHAERDPDSADASGVFMANHLEIGAAELRRAAVNGTLDRQQDLFAVSRRRIRMSKAKAAEMLALISEQQRALMAADDPDGELLMTYVVALFPESDDGCKPP